MATKEQKAVEQEDIARLAAIISANAVVGNDGVVTITDQEKLYENNLPEGLVVENIRQHQDYTSRFIAAATKAVGEAAVTAFVAHKGLETVKAEFPMVGKAAFDLTVQRELHGIAPSTKEPTVTYGSIKLHIESGSPSPAYNHARDAIKQMAKEALGG